jgi:hypothetical protein
MADNTQRWEDNVAGRWYVDRTCILCSLCSDLAPRSQRAPPATTTSCIASPSPRRGHGGGAGEGAVSVEAIGEDG